MVFEWYLNDFLNDSLNDILDSNTIQIPFKYHSNTIQIPFKYHSNTIQILNGIQWYHSMVYHWLFL